MNFQYIVESGHALRHVQMGLDFQAVSVVVVHCLLRLELSFELLERPLDYQTDALSNLTEGLPVPAGMQRMNSQQNNGNLKPTR